MGSQNAQRHAAKGTLMYRNKYDTVLDQSKVAWINSRARRMGFHRQDLDDVQQQVSLALLHFTFDPAKANGATERTAITAVIDRQLRKMRRTRRRHADELSGSENIPDDLIDPTASASLQCVGQATDIDIAMQKLCPTAKVICQHLAQGQSINEISRRLGVSWHTVDRMIANIRQSFEQVGLDDVARA
jgi:DNA-directed RNA polymerase specialized sigma24 family protein